MHTSNTVLTEQVIFSSICVYAHTCMHVITINEKWAHEFEREQGSIYGRVERKEKEEEIV